LHQPSIITSTSTEQLKGENGNHEHDVEETLSDELSRYGYAILTQIVIEDREGKKLTRYIKSTNILGQSVYIYLSKKEKVINRPDDQIYVRLREDRKIPHSLRSGSYNNADLVLGVVLECSNGICCITRNEYSLEPLQEDYVTKNRDGGSVLHEADIIVYPIVKMEDLRHDHRLTTANVDHVNRRIYNMQRERCEMEMEKLRNSLKTYNLALSRLDSRISGTFLILQNTTDHLENMWKEHQETTLPAEEHASKYSNLIYNLKRRRELSTQLESLCWRISTFADDLMRQVDSLRTIEDVLDSDFKGIEGRLDIE
jgi:hypothetical protein